MLLQTNVTDYDATKPKDFIFLLTKTCVGFSDKGLDNIKRLFEEKGLRLENPVFVSGPEINDLRTGKDYFCSMKPKGIAFSFSGGIITIDTENSEMYDNILSNISQPGCISYNISFWEAIGRSIINSGIAEKYQEKIAKDLGD